MKKILTGSVMLLTICLANTASAGVSKPVYRIEKNEPDEIQVRITLPDYSKKPVQVNGKTFYIIQMPDATPILEKGAPNIYKYGGSFAVPENMIGQVEIVSSTFTDETGVAVAPSKGNLLRTVDPATVPYTFGTWYNENKFYPAQVAVLEDQYNLRQIHGQRFSLHAVQYNPATQTLRHYSEIVVRIHMQSTAKSALSFPVNKAENSSEFMEIYKNQFINFQNSGYEKAMASKVVTETGPMLVLCYKSFMTAMQPFIDWKKQSGMKIQMVDAATAGTTPDAIKAYIGNAYHTKHIAFVLLVGDAPQVPTMKLTSGPSDNGYTYQDGDDRYPDLLIGRFSAETEADVKTQVNRSVNYEKNFASTKAWRLKGIGIASDQGPGDNNEYDWQHERHIRAMLMGYKYTAVSELYDGTHSGGVDKAGNPTDQDLATEINNGAGIINYTGHGSSTSFGTTGFNNADVQALTNYDKLPFIFSVACVNGQFNKTGGPCFAEVWLRSTKNGKDIGAVATIMSTINQSWDPPMYGQDEMDSILTESFASNIKRTFGGITFNGLIRMNDRYGNAGMQMTDTWTVFGDPSLKVMSASGGVAASANTDIAQSIIANISPNPASSVMNISLDKIDITKETAVSIYSQNGLFIKSQKLAAGTNHASIPVAELQNGVYYVYVSQGDAQIKLNLAVQH